MSAVAADAIIDLLATRHSRDVFVPECKNGPTHTATALLRLDAWAMRRSWANPCFSGYEVKVSRADFVADRKLHLYLPLCNQFYVVAPRGIVQPEELPAEAGLLEVASTGNRLLTRKKAPYREIEPPIDLLLYVLMCRSTIGERDLYDGTGLTKEHQLAQLREWAEGRAERLKLGNLVGVRIREQIAEGLRAAEAKANKAQSAAEGLEEVARFVRGLGIDPATLSSWSAQFQVKAKLREVCGNGLLDTLRSARQRLEEVEQQIATLTETGVQSPP